ncbi:7TM diverse intracellular signaling domain / GHKL domain multi-domain protein [Leptospira ryugenii]|uniref:7TM diverse intracellular signaling domain / GHKL domain multi-domain protein n=2 Tax=Leptospira ryugenii TaxID=1917863 RepID=A0A2P2E448_9LEPT|nr:7TM diverse intracellular signaling domain / GHKL domain multi-domain protein [Leptospira ryugenii]
MIDLSQSNFEDGFIYDLNGEWQFYWMDFLKPGAEDQRKRNYLNVPSEWQNNGYPEFGHATYKLDINLPAKTTDLALDLRSVACSYEIYANGDLLGKQGKIGTNEGESIPLIRHSIYTIKESLLEDNRLTIILYVSNYHYFKGGL